MASWRPSCGASVREIRSGIASSTRSWSCGPRERRAAGRHASGSSNATGSCHRGDEPSDAEQISARWVGAAGGALGRRHGDRVRRWMDAPVTACELLAVRTPCAHPARRTGDASLGDACALPLFVNSPASRTPPPSSRATSPDTPRPGHLRRPGARHRRAACTDFGAASTPRRRDPSACSSGVHPAAAVEGGDALGGGCGEPAEGEARDGGAQASPARVRGAESRVRCRSGASTPLLRGAVGPARSVDGCGTANAAIRTTGRL